MAPRERTLRERIDRAEARWEETTLQRDYVAYCEARKQLEGYVRRSRERAYGGAIDRAVNRAGLARI